MTRRRPARRTRQRAPGAGRRFVAACGALVAVVFGVPLLLVVCSQVGLDAPHPIPGLGSGAEIKAYFDRDLTATEIAPIAMRGLLIVGWVLWLAMAVSVVSSILEATGSVTRSVVPQFAMFSGLGRWIAAGVTAFSSLAPNFVSAASLSSPRPFTVSSAAAAASAPSASVTPVAPGHARVQRGESIETFAQRTLGDAARWPEIWDLNRNRAVGPDGEVWAMAWKLSAGWDLRLPEGAAVTPPNGFAPPAGGPFRGGPAGPAGVDGAPSDRHHVAAGDSYWSIARGRLGEAASGLAVWDYSQLLIEANAPRLGYDDPAMLRPGDEVDLVAPPGVDFAQRSAEASDVPQILVEAGDSYWSIAEETLGPDAARQEVLELTDDLVDLNSPMLGYDERPMIHPGDVVFLHDPSSIPPPPAPVPDAPDPDPAVITGLAELVQQVRSEAAESPPPPTTIPPSTEPPTEPATTTSTVAQQSAPSGPGARVEAAAPSKSPVGIGEAALLATGVVALLAAKRRARLRAAEPAARLPLPRPETAATERMLRRLDDGERLLRVDIALRAVASVVAPTDHRVVAVRSAPDGTIEVLLSGPVTPDMPWTGGGPAWTLPPTVPVEDLAAPARSVGTPCIALVQIGIDDGGWDVMVDLEAIGVLSVDAPDEQADSVVRAVAMGLACSEFAEVAHLIGVGLDAAVFLGHRQSQTVDSLDEGLELAATLVGAPAPNHRSTFALRAHQSGGERWEPAVVLLASADAASVSPTLLSSLSDRGRVALVAAGAVPGATWRLGPEGSSWVLEPVGIRLVPAGVDEAELASVVDLVEGDELVAQTDPAGVEFGAVAISPLLLPQDVPTAAASADASTNGSAPATPANGHAVNGDVAASPAGPPGQAEVDFADPPWASMVRILGPVELVDRNGSPARFERSKALELVAWMVTHRHRATRMGARTALWEQDVRDATFANVVSEARRTMARHVPPPDGDEWVRRTLTEELSLHDLVVSDAEIAEARYEAARSAPRDRALAILRPAVDSLRDLPFSGTSYLWPETEGIASQLVLLSTNLATAYAKHALAAEDFESVFWATGKGLTVLPGQESLIALRMQAHADAGDLSGVRMEWETYERVINADPWSDGEPAAKLVVLRRQLLSK